MMFESYDIVWELQGPFGYNEETHNGTPLSHGTRTDGKM